VRALGNSRAFSLVSLFGPEHGLWGNAQDLVEVDHGRDRRSGLRVFSLYSETRVPTAEMLEGIDALVVDLQDVGSRYYTFIYTMLHAMEACARDGRRLVVLDRPNPLGGVDLEGNVLDPAFGSFVGGHPLPVRHGMTIGELALLFQRERGLKVDLRVVPMAGWKREMHFEDTGLGWVLPSPNMPTPDTAFVYPGGCLVEGTNVSEGRGTTRPFEIIGAPWIDPYALAEDMERLRLPGVFFRPLFFTPTFHKHAGVLCGGVQVHVRDRKTFRAYDTYLRLIDRLRRDRGFAWRRPPYEYELLRLPFDILCGTDRVRSRMEQGGLRRMLRDRFSKDLSQFRRRRAGVLLYS